MIENPKQILDDAMARIRFQKDRHAVIECGFKGRTFSEVSRELGVTKSTTAKHYWRAIYAMNRRGREGDTLSEAASFFFYDKLAKHLKPRRFVRERTEEEVQSTQHSIAVSRYVHWTRDDVS